MENQPVSGFMSTHPKVTRPWQMWSIDFFGPLPRSRSGNTHVLVICDYFSKFALFFLVRKATATVVVRLVDENVILFFGAPQFILADNGVQFRSKVFVNLANKYGSTIIFNPVYHTQANPAE